MTFPARGMSSASRVRKAEREADDPPFHVAATLAVDPSVADLAAERRHLPVRGVAPRKGIHVPVEEKHPAPGLEGRSTATTFGLFGFGSYTSVAIPRERNSSSRCPAMAEVSPGGFSLGMRMSWQQRSTISSRVRSSAAHTCSLASAAFITLPPRCCARRSAPASGLLSEPRIRGGVPQPPPRIEIHSYRFFRDPEYSVGVRDLSDSFGTPNTWWGSATPTLY